MTDWTFTLANSAGEREQAGDFLIQHIGFEIAPNVVPRETDDSVYDPVIVLARRADDPELVGVALSCRAQVCTIAAMYRYRAPYGDYRRAKGRHSELDVMAVAPQQRGQSVGTQMVAVVERELQRRGVRFWFGNITNESDVPSLVRFYERCGFTVLPTGETLPPFMSLPWHLPNVEMPAHHFWKPLSRA